MAGLPPETSGGTETSGHDAERQGRFLRIFTAEGSFDVQLADGMWTVGRGSDVDVRIDDPSVSRAHARLRVGEHVVLEDLGSANGTRVGGRPIEPKSPVLIASGMPLEFGNVLGLLRIGHERGPTMRSAEETGASRDGSDTDRVLLRIARAELPVLVEGETGVGKGYTVQRLHALSRRSMGPLVQVSCALVRAGRIDITECFARAASGSLVLDEITDLDANAQALLIGAWESSLERSGPSVSARIVSMSISHLEDAVGAGAFRPDLYYRLAHLTLRIPPLRTRGAELTELASAILDELARAAQRPAPLLSADAVRALQRYPWPGNVRELRVALERALVFSSARVLTASHFEDLESRPYAQNPPRQRDAGLTPGVSVEPATMGAAQQSLKEAAASAEVQSIVEALRTCSGNQTRAAKLLGISRGTLISRLRRYDMPRPRK